jgi:hypothetical protein
MFITCGVLSARQDSLSADDGGVSGVKAEDKVSSDFLVEEVPVLLAKRFVDRK